MWVGIDLDLATYESCKQACIGGQLEAGSGLDEDGQLTRPADILVQNREFGKPAALDFKVTSPLNPTILNEASVTAGSAALAAKIREHANNDKVHPFVLGLHSLSHGVLRLLGRCSHQMS